MEFEKKRFSRFALFGAALVLSGCISEPPPPPPAPPPAEPEVLTLEQIVSEAMSTNIPKLASEETHSVEEAKTELGRLSAETEALRLEKELIEARLALAASENERALASMQLEKTALEAECADAAAKVAEEIAGITEERMELERRLALETAQSNLRIREKQERLDELEVASRALKAEMTGKAMSTSFSVAVADKKEQLSKLAPAAALTPKYLKDPFVDGTLYISDRRVALNGPVTDALAESVCEQLYFYDNQNADYPIFLVIDSSPGGSVAAGYQIQKAMQSCRAPVYVVVKNFAASMAAVIATTAERSFCFSNTQILHHQISSGVQGNLTVMREGVAKGELWYKRFLEPVARKMGISLEELTKQMYAHNSDGDWSETGTRAVELKWIDHLATRIEETGVISIAEKEPEAKIKVLPAVPASKKDGNALAEKTDAQGRRYVELPVLENPFDFWAIYDKNNYYRTR